jgi:ribonuclease HI
VSAAKRSPSDTVLVLHADGACRGNPGPAGAGAVVETPDGELVAELKEYLGPATNNIAEYRALLLGLEAARRRGAAEVTVRMDSQLVVRQVAGTYKVRDAKLRLLHAQVEALRRSFRRLTVEYVPREENEAADRLANLAIDERGSDRSVENGDSGADRR